MFSLWGVFGCRFLVMWLNVKMLLECGYLLSLAKDIACSFLELLIFFIQSEKFHKYSSLLEKTLDLTTSCPTSSLVGGRRLKLQSNCSFSLQASSPSEGDPQKRDTWLISKVQTLNPLIQGFRVSSFPPVIWEGDSMHEDSIHAVLLKIKGTMPGLTAVTVLTGITAPASSGLGINMPCR